MNSGMPPYQQKTDWTSRMHAPIFTPLRDKDSTRASNGWMAKSFRSNNSYWKP